MYSDINNNTSFYYTGTIYHTIKFNQILLTYKHQTITIFNHHIIIQQKPEQLNKKIITLYHEN